MLMKKFVLLCSADGTFAADFEEREDLFDQIPQPVEDAHTGIGV